MSFFSERLKLSTPLPHREGSGEGPWLGCFIDYLFPRYCPICNRRLVRTEHSVCTSCLLSLPRIAYHGEGEDETSLAATDESSPQRRGMAQHGVIERHFWGKVPIERATSGFRYDCEQVRTLVHAFKYHQQPHLAADLAAVLADHLLTTDFFQGVDALLPLPLHWRRLWRRGYNQSEYIARGIARRTRLPVLRGVVRRTVDNPSQTRLTRHDREQNVAHIFAVTQPQRLAGRHILLVDDVMTTGATLLSCMSAMQGIPDLRLSVLTLAYAGMIKPELV